MKTRAFALIELLIVIVIIALLVTAFSTGGFGLFGGDGEKKGAPQIVRESAIGVECQNNIRSVRQAIEMAKLNDIDSFAPPQTLEETRLGSNFYICPVGKQPYVYNPSTGQVSCTHPGHEKH
ncbi:MAG: prepilin-type N-terminal cleavage/methylation domain-containing protein [Fimbriimonadaceae bacterium]